MPSATSTAASTWYIIEATGGGVAIIDYDRDGWPDIFLVNGQEMDDKTKPGETPPTSHLFRVTISPRWHIRRRHRQDAVLTITARGQGACVGDYDNDGYDDLYVTGYGFNRLYHNATKATARLRKWRKQPGVAGTGKEWGTGCAFVDYDRDGKLDIAIANYVHFDLAKVPPPGEAAEVATGKACPSWCGPRGLDYTTNILYHNLGNGKFTRTSSKSSGFEKTTGHYYFSVTTLDYDNDGWPDIYVACDSTPSILYHNNRNGTFTDTAADVGVAFNEDGREQAGNVGSNCRRLRRRRPPRPLQDQLLRRHLHPLHHNNSGRHLLRRDFPCEASASTPTPSRLGSYVRRRRQRRPA